MPAYARCRRVEQEVKVLQLPLETLEILIGKPPPIQTSLVHIIEDIPKYACQ